MTIKKLNILTSAISALAVVIFAGVIVYGANIWTSPTANPPGDNTYEPLNVSGSGQFKDGGLLIGKTLNTSQSGLLVPSARVGIGTLNPQAMLDVNGNVNASGNVNIDGNIRLTPNKIISSNGRMHISGDEKLYLLNKDGAYVSDAWGGNGIIQTDGGIKFKDGTIQTTAAKPSSANIIYCDSGPVFLSYDETMGGYYTYSFSAGQCSGKVLPDATYFGAISKIKTAYPTVSMSIVAEALNAGEPGGPGIGYNLGWNSPNNGSVVLSRFAAVYIKK